MRAPNYDVQAHIGESRATPRPSYPRRRVSSTPRPLGSITDVSGILDRPPSRTMTAVDIPAARFARALPTVSPKQEGAGNAGCLLHPRSRVQEMEVEAHTSIQVQPEHSGIPCAMVLRLMPRSPRRRIPLASVIGELTASRTRLGSQCLRRLDASHGRQDHTVLPYASASFVCRAADRSRAKARPAIPISAAGAAASTAFRPTSVTIAIRPSWRAGTSGVVRLIWGWREEVYFCGEGWTGQIALIGLGKLDRADFGFLASFTQ